MNTAIQILISMALLGIVGFMWRVFAPSTFHIIQHELTIAAFMIATVIAQKYLIGDIFI